MRTKGLVAPVHQNEYASFSSSLCHAKSGKIMLAINGRAGIEDCDHAAACWNAIEAIGGDPADVGELVTLLSECSDSPWRENEIGHLYCMFCHHRLKKPVAHDDDCVVTRATTLLAKLPGAKP